MTSRAIAGVSLVALVASLSYAWTADDTAAKAGGKLLSHNVYFALKDGTAEARQTLIDLCQKHLTQHEGLLYFACGELCDEVKGPLNDRDFDVAIVMVFADHESLSRYARSAPHQQFIAEVMPTLKGVRVFDVDVERSAVPADKE